MKPPKHPRKCDILLVGYEEVENLGLRYIASFLQEQGILADIQPYLPEQKEMVLKRILSCNPRIVGFSLIFQRMLEDFNDLIHYLRSNGCQAHFTMGGHFPTIEYEKILRLIRPLDTIVCGEGEETLFELYKNIEKPKKWKAVRSIAFREGEEVIKTPSRPLIKNLDALPFPLRNEKPALHRNVGISALIASRGCYFDCSFCSIRQFYNGSEGSRRRTRSPENVVAEMARLYHLYGVRIFIFEDDDFLLHGKKKLDWLTNFVIELIRQKLDHNIIWRISCRIDEVDEDLINLMASAGLISIYLGIESGNNHGLSFYNKRYHVDAIYKSVNILIRQEMPFEFGFMILNPETSFETLEEDIKFLKHIGNFGEALVHFTKMLPYAGTPVSEMLIRENRLKGSLAAPDYTFRDSRLDLLQHFFTLAFHKRNFSNSGLVERLRYAKLDSIVLDRLFPGKYKSQTYKSRVRQLIRKTNMQCLETISIVSKFMARHTDEEILMNWGFVEKKIQEELSFQHLIEQETDLLTQDIL